MKNITLFILLISFLGYGQRKREVIDSIHSKRLCVEYPGIVDIPTVLDEFFVQFKITGIFLKLLNYLKGRIRNRSKYTQEFIVVCHLC